MQRRGFHIRFKHKVRAIYHPEPCQTPDSWTVRTKNQTYVVLKSLHKCHAASKDVRTHDRGKLDGLEIDA